MNFQELQDGVKEWANHNFPKTKPYYPLLGVQEEVGELSHVYLKREQKIRGTYDEHTEGICDAVGDIVVFLADFCNRNGINLNNCVKSAWQEASQRDWIKYPKNGRTE